MTIVSLSGMPFSAWMLATLGLSALLTALTIRYARSRRMLDLPGQRRSHMQPTPRGGGLGIVVAVLVCIMLPVALFTDGQSTLYASVAAAALALVATVGWIDDHGGLRARYRFAAHCIAAALLLVVSAQAVSVLAFNIAMVIGVNLASAALATVSIGLAIVWSINLHNFMDGINGLLASQAIFVFVTMAAIGIAFGSAPAWMTSLVAAAAVIGFLPFNFPNARVFMGDVGSGALGLLIAMAVVYQLGDGALDAATGLIACSAFVTDATATLLSRMLRGRRWYDAHREHLYQGLVRSGYSHARVVGLYLGWNLLVALPAMLLIQSPRSVMAVDSFPLQVSPRGLVVLLAVYAVALATWVAGKRWCVRRLRVGGHRGLA